MNAWAWLQLALLMVALGVTAKPLGRYLTHVLDGEGSSRVTRWLAPLEKAVYRFLRVDPAQGQDWKSYAVSLLAFSFVGMLATYAILRVQAHLPLNPQGFAGVDDHLAFNTAASFTTNTNWQSYAGESTMSYASQMFALVPHNFTSAAAGIAVAAALARGLGRGKTGNLGNFWADVVRVVLYVLLPLSVIFAVILAGQGMIQNFAPYTKAVGVDALALAGHPQTQTIAQGPLASQAAIKILGTNGGGFMNANAAHPFENPTPLSNFLQIVAILLIPSALTHYLGRRVGSEKHGWAVWSAMAVLFVAGFLVLWWAEATGNPRLTALGVDPAMGNMEGKEVRFGSFGSSLFAAATTAASCGAVNAMHDSFTPLGGFIPLLNMLLGEVVFGGVGAGLYGMLIFVVLAIFIAGLMIGRTPEYLGKKIESYDVKAAALAVLIPALTILGFTAWAAVSPWGLAGRGNEGPHGFSEILYAFTSATANNGSAFAGLTTSTAWYDVTLAVAMLVGRFFIILPVLALAGNMARKGAAPVGAGTFPVTGVTFTALLIGTVVIVGALTFLPALAIGPVLEHFLMVASTRAY